MSDFNSGKTFFLIYNKKRPYMDIIQTIEMSEFEDTLGYFEKVEILKDINKKIQAIVRERKTINRIMIESSEYSLLKLEKLEINN